MKKLCCVLFVVSCLAGIVSAEEAAETKGSLPSPEKGEMRMDELKASRYDLDGKIIKTAINFVTDFEQASKGQYRAFCGYYDGGVKPRVVSVIFPEKGEEFFRDLAKKTDSGVTTPQRVYLRVGRKALEAVGTRYSKSDETYKW